MHKCQSCQYEFPRGTIYNRITMGTNKAFKFIYCPKCHTEIPVIKGIKLNRLINFNLNDYVFIKLTAVGKEEHKRQYDELNKSLKNPRSYNPPEEDVNGWSKWQLHTLFSNFGHMIYLGCDPPFETTIKLEFNERSK